MPSSLRQGFPDILPEPLAMAKRQYRGSRIATVFCGIRFFDSLPTAFNQTDNLLQAFLGNARPLLNGQRVISLLFRKLTRRQRRLWSGTAVRLILREHLEECKPEVAEGAEFVPPAAAQRLGPTAGG